MEEGSILVADGHEDLSQLVAELLRAEGYKVFDFNDAAAALKCFSLNGATISKAIIDDELMNEDNVPLISALKELSPGLGIVALSNKSSEAGVDAIQKPLDFHQLLQAIKT